MRTGYWRWLVSTWAAAIGMGLWLTLDYELTPAPILEAKDRWPAESQLAPSTTRSTLVMFVHPHCPCTRASVDELSLVASSRPEQAEIVVVFVKPPEFDDAWERTDVWKLAETIPGAKLVADVDGVEARRFQANVSGETYLYSRTGELLFHGGLTASRGHRGDNAGRDAVESLLSGAAALRQTPVFGCRLLDDRCTTPESPHYAKLRDANDEASR